MKRKKTIHLTDYLRDKDEVPALAVRLVASFPDETENGVAIAALLQAASGIIAHNRMSDQLIEQFVNFFRSTIEVTRIVDIIVNLEK